MGNKMKEYKVEKEKEVVVYFDKATRRYTNKNESEIGMPPFERCVEVPWVKDKVSQIATDGMKLIDFGCNKAQYIVDLKNEHNLKTYGTDMKSQGSNFVDVFFKGEYNDKIEDKVISNGPYDIATAISAVEHAGCKRHPDIKWITNYQKRICKVLIENSSYFFLSVPFGQRPGWAKDKSRKNLHQFDESLINSIVDFSISIGRSALIEPYILSGEHWIKSSMEECSKCSYRENKQGASAIVLLSVWKDEE